MGFLFAGFNTGNNLFYLIFTILASTELVGFVLARWILRGIEAEILLPARARAGAPMRATIRLTNHGRLSAPAMRWRLKAPGLDGAEVTTPAIVPGGSVIGAGSMTPVQRGWLEVDLVEARSSFPIGLARVVVRLSGDPPKTLVGPRTIKTRAGRSSRSSSGAQRSSRPKGAGEEPMEARVYRPGDDARRIDWKATARTDKLMWRERRGEPPQTLRVYLDRSGHPGSEFEARVSRAAGAVEDVLKRGGIVGFASDEWSLPAAAGSHHRHRIGDYLALVRPHLSGSHENAPVNS